MCPGSTFANTRGGYGFGFTSRNGNFYVNRAGGFVHNRALNTAAGGRGFAGQRNRFAVSADAESGAHSIALDDHEVATVTVNADGSTTISIENKPEAEAENGNGSGAGNGARPAPAEVEAAAHRRSLAARPTSKMSWEKDPADGSITFTPDADEVLAVEGDALMATVVAVDTPPPAG